MNFLQIASLLIVLAGAFGAINYLFLKLPSAIGILIVSLVSSMIILLIELITPQTVFAETVTEVVRSVDFSDTLLEGMLGLLLFAGALHVKISDLREQWRVVFLMATMGVGLSTLIVGTGFSYITGMPFLIALVFGALISPTDPVAVLGVLRDASLRKSLETKIAGESLFNDGVGYVVYLVLVGLAFPVVAGHGADSHATGGLADAAKLFFVEAGGGVLLGLALGWLTFRLMRLIDEILNAVLFLLIGFEVFIVPFNGDTVIAGLLAIVLALVARLAAVAIPVVILKPFRDFSPGVIPIMTWGGLKGGISVALALSLPDSEWKPTILAATYIVVVFSIIVQGLSIKKVATKLGREPELV
jgi:CPA1 family monovalent cation:H+ antiporter